MGQFDGKVVFVTGAGGGIGSVVAAKFAQEGAKLVLAVHHSDSDDEILSKLGVEVSDYLVVTGDIGQPETINTMVEQAVDKFGQIDVMAHVAGGFAMGAVHDLDIDTFEKLMYLNAHLTYVACGRIAKHMVEKGVQGAITVVLARAALSGAKNMAAYAASKAAAERIMQSMAQDLKEHNIRVNGVLPSTVDTAANRKDMPKADFSKWVTPEQIADVIAFLSSDAASAISGASVPVYNKA